jgi:hypothetical protein
MRGARIAAAVLGLVVATTACGVVLGVDDIGYQGDAGADADRDAATDPHDGPASPDAAAEASPDAGDAQAPFTCVGLDAALCADFEGKDPTTAYERGLLGNGVLLVNSSGPKPILAPGKMGNGALLEVPALATSNEAGHARLDVSRRRPATHVHLEMDALVSIAPSDETGIGEIFYLGFPSAISPEGCNFTYKYSSHQAYVYASCAANGANSMSFGGPPAGEWAHLTMDVAVVASEIRMTFSNGSGTAAYRSGVTGPLDDVDLFLGGFEDSGPAPKKSLTIDNVVLYAD